MSLVYFSVPGGSKCLWWTPVSLVNSDVSVTATCLYMTALSLVDLVVSGKPWFSWRPLGFHGKSECPWKIPVSLVDSDVPAGHLCP